MSNEEIKSRYMDESREGTHRARRARMFSNQVIHMVKDFVPNDKVCLNRLDEHLILIGFEANAEIIQVPPECDHLEAAALEMKMLETAFSKIEIPLSKTDTLATDE